MPAALKLVNLEMETTIRPPLGSPKVELLTGIANRIDEGTANVPTDWLARQEKEATALPARFVESPPIQTKPLESPPVQVSVKLEDLLTLGMAASLA